jgi:ATP-dependent Zn protease
MKKTKKYSAHTAYHEAGHVVAAIAQGLEVEHATVVPNKTRGTQEWYSAGRTKLKEWDYGQAGVITLLSGRSAQKKWSPSSVRKVHSAGDFELAQMYSGVAPGTVYDSDAIRDQLQRRWKRLQERSEQLIHVNWKSVETIAERLLEEGELGEVELKAIYENSGGGPLDRCTRMIGDGGFVSGRLPQDLPVVVPNKLSVGLGYERYSVTAGS